MSVFIQKDDVLTRLLNKSRRKNNSFDNSTQFENNEVSSYFAASLIAKDEKISNVIEYWKNQKTQYSLLVKMTKDVLAMSCSDVEVKRLFNLVKDVITYKRERLNFHTIESMMMIKYNLNYDEEIDFFSSSNEYFANEFSASASQILSFIMIENNTNHSNDTNHSNENSQWSEIALNEWNDEKFSKKLFSDEIQVSSACKLN
jgi:hypothetical protein